MRTGLSATDLSYLTPYHQRTLSQSKERRGGSSLEQRRPNDMKNGSAPDRQSQGSASNVGVGARPQRHQRLVFSDPIAFRYLEEDPATTVLERRRRLSGYELYAVEQWACSRTHPTFIICTYTGDMSHSILVNVLGVPVDESTWSRRLIVYFDAVSQFHARKKETPLGDLMITNLNGFPSALTVISVPDGDIKKHREDFIVNEDLKRMGCSGRAGLSLQYPQASTVTKFHNLYRTNESVPLYASVIELVKLCQTALVMYGKLLPAYADGLLCDMTEKAINDWWSDIGSFFYNIEPTDGILGPTTVAALLGLSMGAYNRLKATGAPVGKDILDILSMKRAIGTFQRTQRIEKTRRLDRQTLDKLHRATAKAASGEGGAVAKAVKSTVAELSGKGGEMVMGVIGGKEKAGIAEVETLDIERLGQLMTNPKTRWLWQGKPIKSSSGDVFGAPADELNGRVFSSDDQGNFMWTSNRRDSIADTNLTRRLDAAHEQETAEGKSGLGRLRDAVGIPVRKSHQTRQIREEEEEQRAANGTELTGAGRYSSEKKHNPDHTLRIQNKESSRQATTLRPLEPASAMTHDRPRVTRQDTLRPSQQSKENLRPIQPKQLHHVESIREKDRQHAAELRDEVNTATYQNFSSEFQYEGPDAKQLKRSKSAIKIRDLPLENPRENRHARNQSFSSVEDTVLRYGDVLMEDSEETEGAGLNAAVAMKRQELAAIAAQRKMKAILLLQHAKSPWVDHLVNNVEILDRDSAQHLEELNNFYYQRLEEYQALSATSKDVVGDEQAALADSVRRVEMLGAKLDYELAALQSRVQEVEDGVDEFQKSVINIEARVKELALDERTRKVNWFYEFLRVFGDR